MSNSSSNLRPLGAIPVKNEKGEMTMQKVKVHRYVSGRKPKYAETVSSSDSENSGDELELRNRGLGSNISKDRGSMAFTLNKNSSDIFEDDGIEQDEDEDDEIRFEILKNKEYENTTLQQENAVLDRRMLRLMNSKRTKVDDNVRPQRSWNVHSKPVAKPEVIHSETQNETDDDDNLEKEVTRPRRHREVIDAEIEEEDENEDENVERRHELLRQRRNHLDNHNLEADSEEEDEEDEESDYEDYSDSEEDVGLPRLKPVFVPKNKRNTIIEKEIEEEARIRRLECEKRIATEQRRKEAWKLIEEERRREEEEEAKTKVQAEEEALIKGIASILTDDEEEEIAFELWKVRELKRIKRDREEEESREKELREIERLRNMTEEERQAELEKNPRLVTNQTKKGKYKFMQKYFHRGAFYLDKEDEVFTRDFAQPTLEDHFDKSSLPSVMQVKNFGRAGRTKYTHLVDQDTSKQDSAWSSKDNVHAIKFHNQHGGGMKQAFDRPGKKK